MRSSPEEMHICLPCVKKSASSCMILMCPGSFQYISAFSMELKTTVAIPSYSSVLAAPPNKA